MNPRLHNRKTLRFITEPSSADAPTGAGAPAEVPPSTPDEAPAGSEEEGEPAGEPGQSEDDLPDWGRAELARARSEAAKYRTAAREAREALEKAKTPEEVEAATQDLVARNAELEATILRDRVARKHALPDELAARLQGTTEDELAEDAKKLAALIVPVATPRDPSGGLDPANRVEDFDPVAEARKARSRRY